MKRIDDEEKERISEANKTLESKKSLDLNSIFESEVVPKVLEESPLVLLDCIDQPNLPMNSLLYSRILGTVYPDCKIATNLELLKTYLDRSLILPILVAPLSEYKTDFAGTVVQYPYIGARTLNFLRYVRMIVTEEADQSGTGLCPTCFRRLCNEITVKARAGARDQEAADFLCQFINNISAKLTPTALNEFAILENMREAVDHRNLNALTALSNMTDTLYTLRNSLVLDATPQANFHDLANIRKVAYEQPYAKKAKTLEEFNTKEWMAKALNIDCNPDMPIDEYLDIIIPRKKKISSLLNQLMKEGEHAQSLSDIRHEIWKINEEISSSKKIESMTFTTSLVHDNAKILLGMLIGGLIGYSSGSFAACGAGSIGGLLTGVAEKIISKRGAFKIPVYPRKTAEWIKGKIENPQERMLSVMLSKDIKVIQVWALRRKLKSK